MNRFMIKLSALLLLLLLTVTACGADEQEGSAESADMNTDTTAAETNGADISDTTDMDATEEVEETDQAAEDSDEMSSAGIDNWLQQVNNGEIENDVTGDTLDWGHGYFTYYGDLNTLGVDNIIYNTLQVQKRLETGDITEENMEAQAENLMAIAEGIEYNPDAELTDQVQQTPEIRNAILEHFSAAAYPLHFWTRTAVTEESDPELNRFSQKVALLLGGLLLMIGNLSLIARFWQEWPPLLAKGKQRRAGRRFIRHMYWRHDIGVRMAQDAVQKSARQETITLAKLMLGEHRQQLDILDNWWQSWFDEPMAPLSDEEYEQMKGMPDPARLEEMEQYTGLPFEKRFLELMIFHHRGAIAMSDTLWREKGDPRILLLADAIRHSQTNQIKKMEALQEAA